ncbi:MAG: sigma-54-dependent Fis family transcriptional regulator [Candidatus Rokubacteria bacterium]|nr:sigma-54-dependent Fis family transcriptional regulator [Candidatus Rokubacteria bacterium]
MSNALRLLVVEDEQELRDILVQGLARKGFIVAAAADGDSALATLADQEFDVVLLDLRMPRKDGIQVLQQIRADGHDAEVIIVTGHADVETAIEALKLHAFDYLTKPFPLAELLQVVNRASEYRRLRRENRSLRRAVSQQHEEPLLYGQSRAMDRLRGLLDRASQSGSNVLILGESGSGKELAARSVHRASARRDLPFLAINCAALPDELLESELFGHERGAFTGATGRRHGLLELAHEGTLFLDEVGEMSVAMQAKLLRALDRGEIRRLGGDRTLHVDVRIIAATNKDLAREAAAGQFRHDLYYRLGVIVIEMPSLRERVEDIPLLIDHFVQQVLPGGRGPVKLGVDALNMLMRYPWPGNVRELRNVVERLSVLAPDGEVSAAEVALYLPAPAAEDPDTGMLALDEVERRHILKVLQRTGGNRARAAKILGVDPKTLYNKLKMYNVTTDR